MKCQIIMEGSLVEPSLYHNQLQIAIRDGLSVSSRVLCTLGIMSNLTLLSFTYSNLLGQFYQ